jgi:hypothetical protein
MQVVCYSFNGEGIKTYTWTAAQYIKNMIAIYHDHNWLLTIYEGKLIETRRWSYNFRNNNVPIPVFGVL